jgi:hypothetical protein
MMNLTYLLYLMFHLNRLYLKYLKNEIDLMNLHFPMYLMYQTNLQYRLNLMFLMYH